MALGMVLWNKKGIVLSADIKGIFPCREFNKEDIFQELELGKEIYKYYIYKDKYVIMHPGLIEGNPVGLDLFELENPNLDLTDMVIALASYLEKRVLPKRKYDYFVAGYVSENQYVYHIEVSDVGVTINCKLNSEANVMLLGCSDIAKNILYTVFNVVELKDMTENEMIEVSKHVYFMSSDLQESLRCVRTISKECNVISITPEGLRHKFLRNRSDLIMCKCNCNSRKEMLEKSLRMYENALLDIKQGVIANEEKLLKSVNARNTLGKKADLVDFYNMEIQALRKELLNM